MTRDCTAARLRRGFWGLLALVLPVAVAAADTFPITVVNNCATPITVRGRGNGAALADIALAKAGGTGKYDVTLPFVSGNIFGCWSDTSKIDPNNVWEMEKSCGMAEMTVRAGGAAANINLSYVDILTMPMQIEITGASGCNAGGSAVDQAHCNQKTNTFTLADAQKNCPTTTEGGTVGCWGAAKYCDPSAYAAPGGDPNSAFCKALDAAVKGCATLDKGCQPTAADLAHPSYAVYGCTGFFATEAGRTFCGEINRGTFANKAKPYTTGAFNAYAQHVHAVAGTIYAFPYDDVGNQSGDVGAATATGMTITYCPG